jgi:hypothetical protein
MNHCVLCFIIILLFSLLLIDVLLLVVVVDDVCVSCFDTVRRLILTSPHARMHIRLRCSVEICITLGRMTGSPLSPFTQFPPNDHCIQDHM